MTLGGEQVVELDFVSMHVTLAYGLCGARLEGDPYEIPGFTRKQGKLGLLTAINATSIPAAIASLTDARGGKPVVANQKDALHLIEAHKARHARIEKMLCSDAGMRLMNIDARIMMIAVERLTAKGIEAIPIHDSIVVAQQHESEAREALNFGCNAQNPQLTPCTIDKKCRNSLQDGCTPSGADWPPPPVPGSGWWSSVLADARYDVAEWCA
jgi:hypothetical protein